MPPTAPISNYSLYVQITNTRDEPRQLKLDVMMPAWLIEYAKRCR